VPPDELRADRKTITMIAFIRPPEESHRSPALERVHRLLASTLLSPFYDPAHASPIVAWKAWLLAGWLTMVVLWSVAHAIDCLFY
jgi:hypothetical protein